MTSPRSLASFIPGPTSDSPSLTQGGRRMREGRTYGTMRGAPCNGSPYRDRVAQSPAPFGMWEKLQTANPTFGDILDRGGAIGRGVLPPTS
jgi:hypothetical protein